MGEVALKICRNAPVLFWCANWVLAALWQQHNEQPTIPFKESATVCLKLRRFM